MIDHAEVRELLELAAVEPGGLDRLAAGDTAESAAAAGHLAGCPSCVEEARRLAAIGPVLREAVAGVPPDELRASTLALVKAVGRERPVGAAPALESPAAELASASTEAAGRPSDQPAARAPLTTRPRRIRWAVLAAAAVIVVVAAGGLLAVRSAGESQTQADSLADLNEATLEVSAQPDAVRVALVGATDPNVTPGTLLFSSKSEELVVSAPSLTEPPRGQGFACWMTRPNGSRVRLGWMEFGGGLAYWSGWSKELAQAGPGTTFGVSLVDADGKPVAPGDVLIGTVERG
jgi:hypothetical protein